MWIRIQLIPVALVLPLTSGAWGQTVLHTYVESEAQAQAGDSVALWEDVNGDGFIDWVLGVPGRDGAGSNQGQVMVFSGSDNTLLSTIDGAQANGRFGSCVANAGDLDGDGFDELVVGASGERRVYAYSGGGGAQLWSVHEAGDASFGMKVSGAGDVNGDAAGDVAVSASGGVVHTRSGLDGGPIYRQVHNTDPFNFGRSLAGVGDVDGNGFDDVLVGNPALFGGFPGPALILGGPTGSVIRTIPTPMNNLYSQFGWAVCSLGDQDGDGVREYAISDPYDSGLAYVGPGYVTVYSGATGSVLSTITYAPEFGTGIANAGDVDADGFDDLLVGSALDLRASVHSVAREVLIYEYTTNSPSFLGWSVAGGKDVNGDGWPDALVGAGPPSWNFSSPQNGGAVLLTLGCPSEAVYNYCAAVANSSGLRARMHWQNTTSISNNDFRLWADQCPPNNFGLFFYGTAPTEIFVGDGHLCVTGGLYRTGVVNTGITGTPSHNFDFTSPPVPAGQISAGETWFFSFWFRDPAGGPAGFNFADGLRATFCP